MTKQLLILYSFLWLCMGCSMKEIELAVEKDHYDLSFGKLSTTWDEGIPLGNATVGSLVWQKGKNLRLSIDRIDLWDLRNTEELTGNDFSFAWLYEHVKDDNYKPVQERFDCPYSKYPGPSKIPGAGMELPLSEMGEVSHVHLYQRQAVCEVLWNSGIRLQCFVHAEEPIGWFVLDGVQKDFTPQLVSPSYCNRLSLCRVSPPFFPLNGYPSTSFISRGTKPTQEESRRRNKHMRNRIIFYSVFYFGVTLFWQKSVFFTDVHSSSSLSTFMVQSYKMKTDTSEQKNFEMQNPYIVSEFCTFLIKYVEECRSPPE